MPIEEKRKHFDAYLYWFNLTEQGYTTSDAIDKTAEQFGMKSRGMWNWYRDYNWKQRAITKREKIREEVEKREIQTLADNKGNYLKILHKLLDEYIKAGLPTKIESVRDLEIVIKNCLILQDAPSEVTKSDNQTVNVNVDAESLFDESLINQILSEETSTPSEEFNITDEELENTNEEEIK